MAKTDMGIGRKHADALGLERLSSYAKMEKTVKKLFGKAGIEALAMMHETEKTPALYAKKNYDYDFAMFIGGAFDRDIVMNAYNWIYKNRERFGETILEIGCDIGLLTTYLAKIFPDRKIVAIDRESEGIEFAKINCNKLGIKNVEFICTDPKGIEGQRFDTVISLRTVHENCHTYEDCMDQYPALSDRFAQSIEPYIKGVKALVADGGNYISMEKMHVDALFGGYIRAASRAGLKCDIETYDELDCRELDWISKLQCMIFSISSKEIDDQDVFIDCYQHHIDLTLSEYYGWDAKIMLSYTALELIEGYELTPKSEGCRGRFAVFQRKYDPSCIMYYDQKEAYVNLKYYDIIQLDGLLRKIRGIRDAAVSSGNFDVIRVDSDYFELYD